MEILIKAAQLILSLSILVTLHELGHFIPARLFKTRVEKFYLFFNPWFSVVKKKIGDTEWGLGWIPLGGYVKIAGMVDESMDTEQLKQPAQPWEFRSKPAWQRLIIMVGGVTVNLLLGLFIYIMVMFAYGEEKIYTKDLTSGLSIHPYLKKYNLVSGDNILKINGEEVTHVNDINTGLLLRGVRNLDVVHSDGQKEVINLPEDVDYELFQAGAFPAVSLRVKMVEVDSVMAETPAEKAGLMKGDVIKEINGQPVTFFDDIQNQLYLSKKKNAEILVLREDSLVYLTSEVEENGTIGFAPKKAQFTDKDKIKHVYYGFGESVGKGIDRGLTTLSDYVGQLKFLFTKKGASSIGGFATIGNMFPPVWDWQIFWMTTAFISIVLAFMNILPIPALDGGHVVFLLYEMITGKEAPQKVLEYAQYIGFILLLGLILYANGNDIVRLIFGS